MVSSLSKKWRLFRARMSRYPLWCAWQVTYRCNFHCGFCHYWRDPMGERPEQTVAQFETGARKLASFGTLLVSLAGGEPLVRSDLPDIVRAVARFHFPFVTTNGWYATPELAREMFAAGLWGVSVSLDYADARMHDKRRGMSGAFDRAVAALEHFSAARRYKWQRVNLLSVLLHDNIDQLEDLIKLAARHNAYFMVQPYGDRKTGNGRFRCSDGSVSEKLLSLKAKHPNFLSNPYFLGNFDRFLDGGVPDCRAGQAFFNIDSVGDIAICVEERDESVANLYTDHPRRIIESLWTRSANNTCVDCWYNCRGEVESLYTPRGLVRSLPTLFFDRGRPASSNSGE
ncbi:MAG: radical SAM protein [Planctomycetota bacterium]